MTVMMLRLSCRIMDHKHPIIESRESAAFQGAMSEFYSKVGVDLFMMIK